MKNYFLVVCTIIFLASCSTAPEKQNDRSARLDANHEKETRDIASTLPPMAFVAVSAGTFKMGSPTNEIDRRDNEAQHIVTLTKDFEIGATEVTQLQWVSEMGRNPSYFQEKMYCPESHTMIHGVRLCPNLPVDSVSLNDIREFLIEYNSSMQDGYRYSLPTEAQWEFAARAGTDTRFFFGDNLSQLGDYAWWSGNSGLQTHRVATKLPNAWGLYDVLGNVSEWVQDRYELHSSNSVTDPTGPMGPKAPEKVSNWVVRGGSFTFINNTRSAFREGIMRETNSKYVGFRLVRVK